MSALHESLLRVQREAPAIQQSGVNPHFGSKYVSLEKLMGEILPLLNAHGLVLMQHPTTLDTGMPALRSVIVHAESGEEIADVMPLVLDKPSAQSQGSALTYARRYALMSMLGLVADKDDDGHAASKPREEPKAQETPSANGASPAQHSRLNILLKDIEVKAPKADGQEPYITDARNFIDKRFGKQSRAQLTGSEMQELIDEVERWLEAAKVPFT